MAIRKITTTSILDGTIGSADLSAGCVTGAHLAANSVTTSSLANLSVTTAKIATGAITQSQLATGCVGAAQIIPGSITATELSSSFVGTSSIADGSVTAAKLASNSVTTVKILDANVTTSKIADANVTTPKLADSSVTTNKLVNANVTNAKMAANSVGTSNLIDASVTTAKLDDASVTNSKIAPGAVDSTSIGYTAANVDGDTFNGPVVFSDTLTLSGDPSSSLEAATKQYVDARKCPVDIQAGFLFSDDGGVTGAPQWGQTMVRLTTLPANLTTSVAWCLTPPATALTKFAIKVDDTTVATVTYGTGATAGTFQNTPGIPASLATGARLTIVADVTNFDTTIKGVMISIPATALLS